MPADGERNDLAYRKSGPGKNADETMDRETMKSGEREL